VNGTDPNAADAVVWSSRCALIEAASQFGVVYFDFDSAQVNPGERSKLEAVAAYLRDNAGVGLVVEGHAMSAAATNTTWPSANAAPSRCAPTWWVWVWTAAAYRPRASAKNNRSPWVTTKRPGRRTGVPRSACSNKLMGWIYEPRPEGRGSFCLCGWVNVCGYEHSASTSLH
jgi:hypothetical protein